MNGKTLLGFDWLSTFGLLHGRVPSDMVSYLLWDRRAGAWAVLWFTVVVAILLLRQRQQSHTAVPQFAPIHPDQQWRLAP